MKYPYPISNESQCYHLFDTQNYSYYLHLRVNGEHRYIDRISYLLPKVIGDVRNNGWIFIDMDNSNDPEYLNHKKDYDLALEYIKKLAALF